jgi:hypothetical protein
MHTGIKDPPTSIEQQEKHQCHLAVNAQHMQGSKDPASVEEQEKHQCSLAVM